VKAVLPEANPHHAHKEHAHERAKIPATV
jgi:hypothetical protein